MKLDWKLTLITFVAFVALSPVISTVHEYGHVYVCAGNGYDYIINPTLFGTYFSCDKFTGEGSEQLRLQMYLYGGMFGAATGFLGFMFLQRTGFLKGRRKGIGYALVTIGTMQFVQMILETFAHDFYMNGNYTIPIMSMLSLILLVILLSRGSEQFLVARDFKTPSTKENIPQSIFKRDIRDIIKGNKPSPQRKYTHKNYGEDKKKSAEILQEFRREEQN